MRTGVIHECDKKSHFKKTLSTELLQFQGYKY